MVDGRKEPATVSSTAWRYNFNATCPLDLYGGGYKGRAGHYRQESLLKSRGSQRTRDLTESAVLGSEGAQ